VAYSEWQFVGIDTVTLSAIIQALSFYHTLAVTGETRDVSHGREQALCKFIGAFFFFPFFFTRSEKKSQDTARFASARSNRST